MRGRLLAAVGLAAIACGAGRPRPEHGRAASGRGCAGRGRASRCARRWSRPTRPTRRSWPSASRCARPTKASALARAGGPADGLGDRRFRSGRGHPQFPGRQRPHARDRRDDQPAALFGRPGPQRHPRRRHAGRGRPRRSARDRGRHLHRGGRRLHGRDPRSFDRRAEPQPGPRARHQFAGDPRSLRSRRSDPHRRRPVRRPARARPFQPALRRGAARRLARRITAG